MEPKTPKAPKGLADTTTAAPTPANTPGTKTPAAAPQVVTGALPAGLTLPEPRRGGGKPRYPVDDLEVGGAFGVKNKTKRDLAGIVTRANAKYSTRGKDAAGKTKVISTEREFYAVEVDVATAAGLVGSPLEGSTVLVVRSK